MRVPVIDQIMADVGKARIDEVAIDHQRNNRHEDQPGAAQTLESIPDRAGGAVEKFSDRDQEQRVKQQVRQVPEMVPGPGDDLDTTPRAVRKVLERQVLSHEGQEPWLDRTLAERLEIGLRRYDDRHPEDQRHQQPPDTSGGETTGGVLAPHEVHRKA